MYKNEVQQHGFIWEKELCIKIYNASEEEYNSIPYTSKIDLPCIYNRLDNANLLIKTSCSVNIVCMSDCLTLYKHVSSKNKYHLCVIIYRQDKNIKKIQNIIEVNLSESIIELFGTLTYDELYEYSNMIKSFPKNTKQTKEEKDKMNNIEKLLQNKSGAIKLNRKIDSKTQRRLQCSFNKFQLFLNKYPDRIISQSNNNEFRGGVITSEIYSGPRKFIKYIY